MLFEIIRNAVPEKYSHAFAEHGKAREAWGNHGLPMNSMLLPMLPIPGLGQYIRTRQSSQVVESLLELMKAASDR